MTNPLLKTSTLPFGAVPFDQISVAHFLTALECEIAASKRLIEDLKRTEERPDFENTIAALERITSGVVRVGTIFENLRAAHGNDELQGLAKDMMSKLISFESDIKLDGELFARVKSVYDRRLELGLSSEDLTLTERTYKEFVRNGSLLNEADKDRLREIDSQLATLGPTFSENVLKATNQFELVIEDERDLSGLPPSAVESAAQTGSERGKEGKWVFTLHAPSFIPFIRYADRRELRRKIWKAYSTRALDGQHGNQEIVKKIAKLRHQRARLLGFESHAAFELEQRMAETPEKVRSFLDRLLKVSKPAAERELEELRAFKKQKTGDDDIQQWDYQYWANKLKEDRFQFDGEQLRPYFKLENVLEGVFEHARRLYGLTFKRTAQVPVYHDDVMVYEVTDEESGEHQGLFYADFFPRATKGGGAWCTRYRDQWKDSGADVRPHVSVVCNFTSPTKDKPSLLSFMEVNTLFHEFGHALHSLLSKCTHRSLSCTSVFRDFVELPSQIMENWIKEKESLALFARHYTSGELIPDDLVEKIIKSENFHAALVMLRQLRLGMLDMAWYSDDPTAIDDIITFESGATKAAEVLPMVQGINFSCAFEHIFAGGYAAGYYGYKWAEVLDADAFELFKEKGIFSKDVAEGFRKHILARGGSEHPTVLYRNFRGRDPDPDALLRRSGLI